MIEIIEYPTKEEMTTGKTEFHNSGFRPLHTDFINNDKSQGYKVTFVNGLDDPDNSPEQVEKRRLEKIDTDRNKQLKQKARDGTLTRTEEKEIIKKLAEIL